MGRAILKKKASPPPPKISFLSPFQCTILRKPDPDEIEENLSFPIQQSFTSTAKRIQSKQRFLDSPPKKKGTSFRPSSNPNPKVNNRKKKSRSSSGRQRGKPLPQLDPLVDEEPPEDHLQQKRDAGEDEPHLPPELPAPSGGVLPRRGVALVLRALDPVGGARAVD